MTKDYTGATPPEMCDQHLGGEYNEWLKLLGGLQKHPHGLAITTGQAKQQNIELGHAVQRFNSLQAELAKRGYSHDKTLVPYWTLISIFEDVGSTYRFDNIMQLLRRSNRCNGGTCLDNRN